MSIDKKIKIEKRSNNKQPIKGAPPFLKGKQESERK